MSSPLPPHRPVPLVVLSHSISHWKVLKQQCSGKWRQALTLLRVTVPAPFKDDSKVGTRGPANVPNPLSTRHAWGSLGSA